MTPTQRALADKPDLLALLFPILPVREYRFHPVRRWRFDYAWPSLKIAVEQDGGVWMPRGAHTRPMNIMRDMEKNNEAQRMGWRIFRFTPRQFRTGEAQAFMKTVFAGLVEARARK